MKTYILLLLTFLTNVSLGQQKNLFVPKNEKGDTTFWYKWNNNFARKLGLNNLSKDQREQVYRIWYNGQYFSNVIEISKFKNEPFTGIVLFYTEEQVDQMKEKPTYRLHFKKTPINDTLAGKISQLIESTGINSIPSDQNVKGWQQGFDGVTYIIENSTPANSTFKTYWTPDSQDSLKEAITVLAFINELDSLLDLKNLQKSFLKDVPFQMYNTGGPATVVKALTKKQRRQGKRERENYRQHGFYKNGG